MGRRGNRNYVTKYSDYIVKLSKENYVCLKCPGKVYDIKEYFDLGIGNLISGKLIIIPYYNIEKENNILDSLIDLYSEVKNRNLLDDVFIVRMFNCNTYVTDVNNSNKLICPKHIINIINTNNITKVVFMCSTKDFDRYKYVNQINGAGKRYNVILSDNISFLNTSLNESTDYDKLLEKIEHLKLELAKL